MEQRIVTGRNIGIFLGVGGLMSVLFAITAYATGVVTSTVSSS